MGKLVALDAGHGSDTYNKTGGKGVRRHGRNYEEHSFNADVIHHAKDLLEYNGINVLLTQPLNKDDVGLEARTDKANRKHADIFISAHANAGVSAADGACCFYWHNSNKGRDLAEVWKKNFNKMRCGVGFHGDGFHESKIGAWTNFHVIRETVMPALLIEHGFMTNKHDFQYIFGDHKDEYRRQCGEAIARAVCDYYNLRFRKPEPKDQKEDGDLYYVQIGAFSSYENARELANKAKKKGFNVYIK